MMKGDCYNDSDCPEEKYCYNLSNQCVNYTQCIRYNRQENLKASRHPDQCGLCLPGFEPEILGTGKMASSCKKKLLEEDIIELEQIPLDLILVAVFGFLLLCFTVAGVLIYKRQLNRRRENSRTQNSDLCILGPTAPPMESSPFIGGQQKLSAAPYNNNQNLKDKNNLERAYANYPPSWVNQNPNYEYNLNDDNTVAVNQSHSVAVVQSVDNNWAREQLSRQIANGNVPERELETMENNANTALIERNDSSRSNATQNNNNQSSNNTHDHNESSSEPSNSQSNRNRAQNSNILINQKISMNVNLFHNDS